MLRLELKKERGYCDGLNRRQALRIGSASLFGGLGLPQLLEMQAQAQSLPVKAEACIMLFLEGGPSTIDMWDLKPDAPAEVRGPFRQISTYTPGTFVGEHCPRCANITDKLTILRSHSHGDNGHQTGYHYLMTGRRARFGDGQAGFFPFNDHYPSIGSIVSRELGAMTDIPPYVNLPNIMAAGGPGFYGAAYAPFVIGTDPVQPDFEVKDLRLTDGISVERFDFRRQMLARMENLQQSAEESARVGAMSTYYEKAIDLVTSPGAQESFDISREPEWLRAEYGYNTLGQCALMARRLVETGCRFIGIDHGSWDTHFTCFPSLEHDLIPSADMAFAALVTDLERRGLLDTTLVVMMGEMGRTPKVNAGAGRDHWSQVQSVLFAGGGVIPGQVLGATDEKGTLPITEPYGVDDVLHTILTQMGIDTTKTHYTPLGRPVPILEGGRLIPGLVA